MSRYLLHEHPKIMKSWQEECLQELQRVLGVREVNGPILMQSQRTSRRNKPLTLTFCGISRARFCGKWDREVFAVLLQQDEDQLWSRQCCNIEEVVVCTARRESQLSGRLLRTADRQRFFSKEEQCSNFFNADLDYMFMPRRRVCTAQRSRSRWRARKVAKPA